MQIQDGTGSARAAGVSDDNRLDVSSRASGRPYYNSRDEGETYAWVTPTSTTAAADTVLLVKNTSPTKDLHIEKVMIGGDATSRFVIHRPTVVVATPTGTANTGTNLNGNSANVAPATAIQDETTNAQGAILASGSFIADQGAQVCFDGAVSLGQNDSIGVDVVIAQGEIDCVIIGYFEDK